LGGFPEPSRLTMILCKIDQLQPDLNSCIQELKILKLQKSFIHRDIILSLSNIKKYCKDTMHNHKHSMTHYISKFLGPSSSIIFRTYRIQSQRYNLVLYYRLLTLDSCHRALFTKNQIQITCTTFS
jgi:hypothetical protein